MPLIKLWNADHSIKKVAHATTLQDVLTQAGQKGICSSENAKVFLKDWTDLEDETFEELLQELPLDERVFVVAEVIPPAPPLQSGSIFMRQCFVATEQQLLFSEPSDFVEATCLVFLCYYVLNMAYATGASTSLEFQQRQIFDINPSKGSKSEGGQKSRTNVHSKIMKLAQKLRFSQ
ncbi:hypothetical protein MTO96_025106 [Rhipicephalus appendiculatus]